MATKAQLEAQVAALEERLEELRKVAGENEMKLIDAERHVERMAQQRDEFEARHNRLVCLAERMRGFIMAHHTEAREVVDPYGGAPNMGDVYPFMNEVIE